MSNNYAGKFVSAETAVKAVQPGDWVDYGFGAGFPELLDRALAARKDELTDVKIRGGLVIRPRIEVVESDPEQKAFSYYSWHIGDYERKLQTRGLCKFMPMMLRSLPEMYRHHIRVDVAFVPVSRPDADGCCGLGISNYAWRTIFENARTVIFEINERLPRLQGVNGSHRVHLSEADFIVEGEHEPLPIRTYRDPSTVDIEIAKRVVEEIPDGAVLSLGVGGVPFTVANMLAQSDKTDLGCHTGTISDAFLALYKAGKLTNKKKEIDNGYSTWNLAMGSQELYDWLDNEPQLFHPADVDYVHSPYRIDEKCHQHQRWCRAGSDGTGKCRVCRHPTALRYRRTDGFPGGRIPLRGRQGLYLPCFHPQEKRWLLKIQHRTVHSGRQHRICTAYHDSVRGDRVRYRKTDRAYLKRTSGCHDRHRTPGFP